MKPIEIGIIGAGRIGRLHAENLVRMNGVRIAAISDLFPEPAEEWAASIGIPKVSGDYRELLQDVCDRHGGDLLATDTHVDLIIAAAAGGQADLLREAGLARPRAGRRGLAAVEAAGVPFMSASTGASTPATASVRDAGRDGYIGDVAHPADHQP